MAFRHNLFLWSGRIIAFALLFLALIFSIAEHVDRDKNGYQIDPKSREYLPAVTNLFSLLKKNPYGSIQTSNGACSEGEAIVLKNWSSIEGCFCKDKIHNTSCENITKTTTQFKVRTSHHPMLLWGESAELPANYKTESANAYPIAYGGNRLLMAKKLLQKSHRQAPVGCENSGIKAKNVLAQSYKDRVFCAVEIKNWTFPISYNSTTKSPGCEANFTLCEEARICVPFKQGQDPVCPLTELEYLKDSDVKGDLKLVESRVPIKGQGFGDGFNFYNNTKHNATASQRGILAGFKVSKDSDPCLHPGVYSSAPHPLQGNILYKDKCAEFSNNNTFKKVTEIELKSFWTENKEAQFFDALPKYYSTASKAVLFQIVKPQIKADLECNKLVNVTSSITFSNDLGDIAHWRYISNITTYIIVSIAFFAFLVYLMLKAKMADSPLSYIIFWFCHICCVTLAIILVIYGSWTFEQIHDIKTKNKFVSDILKRSCLLDGQANEILKTYDTSIHSNYEKIAIYAELLIDISICFLVLEILYLTWYACSFRCRRNIEEGDEDEEEEGK